MPPPFFSRKCWVGKANAAVAFNFRGVPKSGSAARFQISLLNVPTDQAFDAEKVKAAFREKVRPDVEGSVEKEVKAQAVKLRHGFGWSAVFTDASLVGQPIQPNNPKIERLTLLCLDPTAMVSVTMQYDDPNGPEPAAMLKLMASIQFTRGSGAPPPPPADAIRVTHSQGNYELTVSQSKVLLQFPEAGLQPANQDATGNTNNPRYFEFNRPSPFLILSGWFETADKYGGIKNISAQITDHPPQKGVPDATNVVILTKGKWEIVAYDLPLPEPNAHANSVNVRAELTQSGTWLDVHLSTTSEEPVATVREKLLAFLATLQVDEKIKINRP